MFQFMTQQNLLFYVMAAVCAWGVISQFVLRFLYGGLLKDAVRQGKPKGKFMKQMRQRYQSSRRLKQDAMNVSAFIKRNLLEYRFAGISLRGWKRMGGIAMVFAALCGVLGWYLTARQPLTVDVRNPYILAALAAELLILLAYGASDTRFAADCLETVMQDYLENAPALRASGMQASAMEKRERQAGKAAGYESADAAEHVRGTAGKAAIKASVRKEMRVGAREDAESDVMEDARAGVMEGMRAGVAGVMEETARTAEWAAETENGSCAAQFAETAAAKEEETGSAPLSKKRGQTGKTVSMPGRKKKAGKTAGVQKDKQELKQNLSRLKEGIRETAASMELDREQRADVLRGMDPGEQERIIREVLKEFFG